MRREMFSSEGNWYKGNLHSHTTNSDGRLKPEEAVKLYKSYGYHFMCFSEHDVFTDLRKEFDSENFILLPGVEASAWLLHIDGEDRKKCGNLTDLSLSELAAYASRAKNSYLIKTHHIHGILGNADMQQEAGDSVFKNGEQLHPPIYFEEWNGLEAAQKLSDYLRSKGCFTTYNHPVWSRVETSEVVGLKDVWAMEICNYGTVVECGEGQDSVFWDATLRKGIPMKGFASDDNHNPGKFFDSLGGWVCVRSKELTHEAIVNHLLAGDYYFSAGPEICQWGIEDNKVFVECSDVERINFIVGGPVGSSETILKHESRLSGGYHELKGNETYVRVECIDKKGRTAWTNALFL